MSEMILVAGVWSHREKSPSTVVGVRVAVTGVEIAALLAVAQDHAFGQPPGSQLRAAVLGQHLATAAGPDPAERATTWWTSALRFLGCTGHSFDMAVVFGDEIELRARALQADSANPAELLRLMVSHVGPGLSGVGRLRSVLSVVAGGRKAAELNFRTACEVADAFAIRLGLDEPVRAALAANFERWNCRGLPAGPRAPRFPDPCGSPNSVKSSRSSPAWRESPGPSRSSEPGAARPTTRIWQISSSRRRRAGGKLSNRSTPGTRRLLSPRRVRRSAMLRAHESLLVLADFADLKSPRTSGHSRGVAALALEACGPAAEAAALVHDLGRVAVPNTIWDKPGPLTRDERDRAETHALVTDQLLRRVPYTATLAGAAGAAHERLDGSGYHRRVNGAHLDEVQRVIAAADSYQAMTSDRPYRGAHASQDAAAELRAMSRAGRLDGEAVEHIYTKIGVSTRGAATLFAIERGILSTQM
jgi:hypothetical protein